MTAGFGQAFGPPGYRLVDADTHINEPPDLWTSRVSSKFKDRVPRQQSFEQGDAWVMEGAPDPINFGLNAAAGLPFDERRPWMRWADLRPGGHDPKFRLEEMDVDNVDAAIVYPTPRISQLMFATKDAELHLAMVQAYNDWLSEFCEVDPSRLGGAFIIPNRGVDQALAEIERVAGRPGMVAPMIGCYPTGSLDLTDECDPVWHAVTERGLAVHIHVALGNSMPRDIHVGPAAEQAVRSSLRFNDAPVRMQQFIVSGAVDRIPDLRVVFVEVDAGWVPYVKEQLDNRFLRKTAGRDMRTRELPSAVIERHFYYTYITDHFAVGNRHAVGLERLMWSSDFPHSGSDWPKSAQGIHAVFAHIPANERDLILNGNAQRLYKFSDQQS